ncbi:Mite allergen Der f 6 [Smittium culicis]|uniref:Mite allergen Der f 6 n=1 Tax=Smittium culicis TaxID=133412 RepID=A0A1R1XVI5_9FUNG|nr:Mite allergen Der f 6 [Smittium culicis]
MSVLVLGLAVSLYTGTGVEIETLSSNTTKLNKRIAGGTEANFKEFPFAVSIFDKTVHLCGGTLLSNKVVLTAAHCLEEASGGTFVKKDVKKFFVRFGGNYSTKKNKNVMKIKSTIIHKDYDFMNSPYDIGIIFLEGSITAKQEKELGIEYGKIFNRPVQKNMKALAVGWGSQFGGGGPSDKLKVTDIVASHNNLCIYYNDFHEDNNKNTICAINTEGKGVCNGDSGGPLLYNEEKLASKNAKRAVVGVSLRINGPDYGKTKCENKETINYFANALYHLDWISNTSGIPRSDLVYYPENEKNAKNGDQTDTKPVENISIDDKNTITITITENKTKYSTIKSTSTFIKTNTKTITNFITNTIDSIKIKTITNTNTIINTITNTQIKTITEKSTKMETSTKTKTKTKTSTSTITVTKTKTN